MLDPLRKRLVPIEHLQDIRGVQLPVRLSFVQLVVTGPPGSGKTYYINHIHGWPNEGYVDLTRKGWWKDQTLTYRPREVHLGFPFKGFSGALTVILPLIHSIVFGKMLVILRGIILYTVVAKTGPVFLCRYEKNDSFDVPV